MKDNQRNLNKQAGVTLIELLMVCVIITLVSSLAFMQFGGSQTGFQRQNAAQTLKQFLERGRFDSVKRRVDSTNPAKVIISANSVSLVTDVNNNGVTTDPVDTVTTNFVGPGIFVTGNSLTFPVTVTFDKRGEVQTRDNLNNLVSPVFLACSGTCSWSNQNSGNANIVLVTPTGTVNLLPGGAAVPNFSAPTISTIPTGTGIKTDVVLP